MMEAGGAGDRESPKSSKRNKRDPLMRPRSAILKAAGGLVGIGSVRAIQFLS
jgi:hypothetical protein